MRTDVTGVKTLRACKVAAEILLKTASLEKGSGRECMDLAGCMTCSLVCKNWTWARVSLGRAEGRCCSLWILWARSISIFCGISVGSNLRNSWCSYGTISAEVIASGNPLTLMLLYLERFSRSATFSCSCIASGCSTWGLPGSPYQTLNLSMKSACLEVYSPVPEPFQATCLQSTLPHNLDPVIVGVCRWRAYRNLEDCFKNRKGP